MTIPIDAVHISHEDAFDGAKLQAAYAQATTRAVVIDPPASATPAPAAEPAPVAFTTPEPLHISHADALNTAAYRFAKSQAEREGRALIIDPRPAPEAVQHAPGTIFLRKGTSHQEYKAAKARAEAAGVSVVFLEN